MPLIIEGDLSMALSKTQLDRYFADGFLIVDGLFDPAELQPVMDELFFTDRALTNAQIMRIYACGVDGARCTCQAGNPAAYASCGLLQSTCGALPPCNQTGG